MITTIINFYRDGEPMMSIYGTRDCSSLPLISRTQALLNYMEKKEVKDLDDLVYFTHEALKYFDEMTPYRFAYDYHDFGVCSMDANKSYKCARFLKSYKCPNNYIVDSTMPDFVYCFSKEAIERYNTWSSVKFDVNLDTMTAKGHNVFVKANDTYVLNEDCPRYLINTNLEGEEWNKDQLKQIFRIATSISRCCPEKCIPLFEVRGGDTYTTFK